MSSQFKEKGFRHVKLSCTRGKLTASWSSVCCGWILYLPIREGVKPSTPFFASARVPPSCSSLPFSRTPSPLSAATQPPRGLLLTRTLTTPPLAELLHYAGSACAAWGSLCSPPNRRRRWPGESAANMELKQAEAALSQAAAVPGGCKKKQ